jgi:hypothetical protein
VFNFLSDRVASRPKAGDEELPVLGAAGTTDGDAQVTEKQRLAAPSHKYRLKAANDMY